MSVPCLYWPVTVSSMTLRMRRTPNATGVQVTTNTTITAGTYYVHEGSGSLATQVETDFGTVNGVSVAIVVSNEGLVTITVSGLQGTTACEIAWSNSTATQALGTALGFDVSASDTVSAVAGVATFTGDYAIPRYWTPGLPPRADEDDDEREVVVTETRGGQNGYDRLGQWLGREVSFGFLAEAKVKASAESGTTTNGSIERLFLDSQAPGRFRYWNSRDTLGSGYADYFMLPEVVATFRPDRLNEAVPLYSITLRMREFTS